MTDRPIIFSGPMIRALIEGRKTQTRRLVKLSGRMPDYCGPHGCMDDPTCWGWEDPNYGNWITIEREPGQRMGWRDWCGAWRAGDRLWVREAWTFINGQRWGDATEICIGYNADGTDLPNRPSLVVPDADGAWNDRALAWFDRRKRPSIHMPRWASRLTLTVTDVRVQRLQDITEAHALAEGIQMENVIVGIHCYGGPPVERTADRYFFEGGACPDNGFEDALSAFAALWNSIHGPDAWEANPWVAALTFTVERKNIDEATR